MSPEPQQSSVVSCLAACLAHPPQILRLTPRPAITTYFATRYSATTTTTTATPAMLSPTKVAGLSAYIPHRVRRKWRATKSRIHSRQSVTSSIASLETSLSPSDTIKALRTHPWSIYDAQYLFLAIIAIFSLSVSEAPGPFAKTFAATALLCGVLVPATRQFLLPLLPTLTWLFLFNSCKYVILEFAFVWFWLAWQTSSRIRRQHHETIPGC